ncbi:MAG: hypothetical protein KGL98_06295 [Gammaproteobacteria bacterium]|nr:hypothetical protein [Gammaproteobacteria bacterium]MDE2460841.1 hypothetical protein [Gammaproteobacteria bacterium]
MDFASLNLWNPAAGLGPGIALVTAFFLGLIHGITPDEHTWPITFSYSVGAYSTRGGMRAGLLFSAAFTLQRAIASELAYFAVTWLIVSDRWNFALYVVVGVLMVMAGWYVLRRHRLLHLFHSHNLDRSEEPRALPGYMPLVHGFVAGWGTGAFALIVYTVLAPAMPSAAFGFLPGLLYGLGTTAMQILFGAAVGAWMARRQLADTVRTQVARMVAGRTLFWGGLAFIALGIIGFIYPDLGGFGVDTGVRVHNLDRIDVGFLLAVLVPFGAGSYAMIRSLREVRARFD